MKKNKTKRNLRIVGIIFIGFMATTIFMEVYNTFRTNYSITQATNENAKLKGEAKKLTNEVKKLKDDNYIQSYVSGTIFSTEQGTTVYILPEDKTPE